MSDINVLTVIPSRTRALSVSLPVVSTWRDGVVDGGVIVSRAHHNSILSVPTAQFMTDGGAYGAAKQAAPPRGIPR